jgi:hypothetical protein
MQRVPESFAQGVLRAQKNGHLGFQEPPHSALTRIVVLLLLLPLFMIVNVFSEGMTAHIKACGLLAHCDFGELVEKAGWSGELDGRIVGEWLEAI